MPSAKLVTRVSCLAHLGVCENDRVGLRFRGKPGSQQARGEVPIEVDRESHQERLLEGQNRK